MYILRAIHSFKSARNTAGGGIQTASLLSSAASAPPSPIGGRKLPSTFARLKKSLRARVMPVKFGATVETVAATLKGDFKVQAESPEGRKLLIALDRGLRTASRKTAASTPGELARALSGKTFEELFAMAASWPADGKSSPTKHPVKHAILVAIESKLQSTLKTGAAAYAAITCALAKRDIGQVAEALEVNGETIRAAWEQLRSATALASVGFTTTASSEVVRDIALLLNAPAFKLGSQTCEWKRYLSDLENFEKDNPEEYKEIFGTSANVMSAPSNPWE
ncbi:hypothetical protein [Rugamonas aquatica]|uniref:Uncharacterized protein n=1 Tax=Rugamonas aquatica TaxID=2743357 RepID=A0A6A7N6I6_9BURK|nr:hypothetical protein [Rugamonas aquatica]MQA40714.1 hypothetical protein [Rugamonas aquatica]